ERARARRPSRPGPRGHPLGRHRRAGGPRGARGGMPRPSRGARRGRRGRRRAAALPSRGRRRRGRLRCPATLRHRPHRCGRGAGPSPGPTPPRRRCSRARRSTQRPPHDRFGASPVTPKRPTAPTSAAARRPAHVAFVGAGPGDAALLTVAAVELLGSADAVITDQSTDPAIVTATARQGAEIVDAGHGEHGQRLTHASRAKLVVKTAKAHKGGLVVRLMDGDPATFNGLAEEAKALTKANIEFDVVPGVSAVSAVPSYAGVPLTAQGTSALHVVHVSGEKRPDVSAATSTDTTLVLLGQPEDLARTIGELLDAGASPETAVSITSSGTTTKQVTAEKTLGEAAEHVAGAESPLVVVVGKTVSLRSSMSWFETKPLYGWNVLVPRTKDQAGPMTQALLGHGATSDVVPTISVEPPRTPQAVDRAVRGLVTGRYQWIGFTSVNAVKAVREKFEEFGLDARAFSGLKIAAVGGVTADALRAWGLEPDLVPDGEMSARGLLEAWPPYDDVLDPIDRVFLPRADIATDT